MIRKLLLAFAVVFVAFCALGFWSYSDAIARVPVASKLVALTYDDGPNPPHTQALLQVLQAHAVKATFFLKGRNVEAYPEDVRALVAAGHPIGNHSYHHRPMLALRPGSMRAEVERTNRSIAEVTGMQPVLFRPPYGLQGPGLKLALAELDMTSIIMNAHGTDWEITDPQEIAAAVLASVEPGSIILLHDGHGDVDDPQDQDSRAPTVAATGIIIEALHAQDYRFVTVEELLASAAE